MKLFGFSSNIFIEIVEEILAKLYINGSIKEGQLSKKILQTMAIEFIRCNNIGNFSYEEVGLQHNSYSNGIYNESFNTSLFA